MRRLILSTVSVLALGLGGAGLVYAQGDMSSNPKATAGPAAPSASGNSQYGASGTSNVPSTAGTSGYTGGTTSQSTQSTMPSTTGTSQSGYTSGTTSQSSMPSTIGKSHARMSRHDEIVEVQQKLQQDNLYNGKIDGRLNRQTKQALRTFQKQNGLRVTATLDRETRDSLLGTGAMGQGSTTPPKSHTRTTMPAPSHSGGTSTSR
jgi:peptidoglycan hydrolase-like protein with peptidoglycan-binding domain